MTDSNRRLLVIAFHYPPDNTSTGVLRTLKFTQYLQRFGWDCDVVTVPEHIYYSRDPASVANVPDSTRVYRPWAADTKNLFGFRGRYPGIFGIPDRYWPWIIPAVRQSSRLLRERDRIGAVYTTYPVPSALLIGLALKKKFGLPWIVDFRDPWVEDSMPRFRKFIEGRWEKRILIDADRVICNTPRMKSWFCRRYPALSRDKFITITNGYDSSELAGIVPCPRPGFEVLYTGILVPPVRSPRPLFAAARLAIDRGWINQADLRLSFLGAGAYAAGREFRDDVEKYRLGSVVEVIEQRIPYREALQRAAGADVILVLCEPAGDDRKSAAEREWSHLQVPVKVYEGLGLGRRILALVSGGAIADLLSATGSGMTVAPADIEGVARALQSLYLEWIEGRNGPSVNSEELEKYDRRKLAGALANQLSILVSDKHDGK